MRRPLQVWCQPWLPVSNVKVSYTILYLLFLPISTFLCSPIHDCDAHTYIVFNKLNSIKTSVCGWFLTLRSNHLEEVLIARCRICRSNFILCHNDFKVFKLKKCSFLSAEWTFKIYLNVVCCKIAVWGKGLNFKKKLVYNTINCDTFLHLSYYTYTNIFATTFIIASLF